MPMDSPGTAASPTNSNQRASSPPARRSSLCQPGRRQHSQRERRTAPASSAQTSRFNSNVTSIGGSMYLDEAHSRSERRRATPPTGASGGRMSWRSWASQSLENIGVRERTRPRSQGPVHQQSNPTQLAETILRVLDGLDAADPTQFTPDVLEAQKRFSQFFKLLPDDQQRNKLLAFIIQGVPVASFASAMFSSPDDIIWQRAISRFWSFVVSAGVSDSSESGGHDGVFTRSDVAPAQPSAQRSASPSMIDIGRSHDSSIPNVHATLQAPMRTASLLNPSDTGHTHDVAVPSLARTLQVDDIADEALRPRPDIPSFGFFPEPGADASSRRCTARSCVSLDESIDVSTSSMIRDTSCISIPGNSRSSLDMTNSRSITGMTNFYDGSKVGRDEDDEVASLEAEDSDQEIISMTLAPSEQEIGEELPRKDRETPSVPDHAEAELEKLERTRAEAAILELEAAERRRLAELADDLAEQRRLAELAEQTAREEAEASQRAKDERQAASADRQTRGVTRVAVVGCGPGGLAFAVAAAEQAELLGVSPTSLRFIVFDLRLEVPASSESAAFSCSPHSQNRRREQVTRIDAQTLCLFDALSVQTRRAIRGVSCAVHGGSTVAVRDAEAGLLAAAQDGEGAGRYIEVRQLTEEVSADVRARLHEPQAAQPALRRWLDGLDCDVLVGADGANSMVRAHYGDHFESKPQRLKEGSNVPREYAICMGFEGFEDSDVVRSPALRDAICLAQNRYSMNVTNDGARGFINACITESEFKSIEDSLPKLSEVSFHCAMWDVFDLQQGQHVIHRKIREIAAEGCILFGVRQTLPTSMLVYEVEHRYSSNFYAQVDGLHVCLVGDAAMTPHLVPGRGMSTGLRSAVALSRALLADVVDSDERNLPTWRAGGGYASFDRFMQNLQEEELHVRSAALLPEDPSIGSRASISPRSPRQKDGDLLRTFIDRVKRWRDRLEAPGAQEPHVVPSWPVGALRDSDIEAHFQDVSHRPLTDTLKAMNDSARPNSSLGLWGRPLPTAAREVLPQGFGLPDPLAGVKACDSRRAEALAERQTVAENLREKINRRRMEQHALDAALCRKRALEEETVSDSAPVLDRYDFVLKAQGFDRLLRGGWEFEGSTAGGVPQHSLGGGDDGAGAVRVAVIGELKRGKTWLLRQLTKANLSPSEMLPTIGFCCKRLDVEGVPLQLIDMRGGNQPVTDWRREAFADARAEESLVCDVVCDVADICLFVVGTLSCGEQLRIWQLGSQLRERQQASKVIVVHNLRHLTRAAELRGAEEALTEVFRGEGAVVCKQSSSYEEGSGRHPWLLETRVPSGQVGPALEGDVLKCRHYILAAEGSEAGSNNAAVLSAIRQSMIETGHLRRSQLQHDLLRSFERHVGVYLEGGSGLEPSAEFIDGKLVLRHQGRELVADPRPRFPAELELGSFVSIKARTANIVPHRVSESNDHVRIEIDLPGIRIDQLNEVVQIRKTVKGLTVTVKTADALEWQSLRKDYRLIQSQRRPDVSFTIRLERMFKDARCPSTRLLEHGIFVLEWETECDDFVSLTPRVLNQSDGAAIVFHSAGSFTSSV